MRSKRSSGAKFQSPRIEGCNLDEERCLACLFGSVALAALAGCGKDEAQAPPPAKETVTVTDSKGNELTLPCPPERVVVLGGYTAEMIKALGAEKAVIGIDESTKEKTGWPAYVNKLPAVGSSSTPDVEAIVALKPDLVVASFLKPELQVKLEEAGIPVLWAYGYKTELIPQEIRTLGRVFAREGRAEEYAQYIEQHWQAVKERVAHLTPEQKPRVYWESSFGAYKTHSKGSGADPLIRWAGGINIAGEEPVAYPKVSAEWLVEKNPDVIIKYAKRDVAGWHVTDSREMEKLRAEIMARPGLKETNAAKNGRVYLISDLITCAPRGAVGIYYIAKWLHPDVFRDIDPEAIHKEMLEKFYGEELRGTWVLQPE